MLTIPAAVDRAAVWEETEPEGPEPPEPPELFPMMRNTHAMTPAHPPVTANPSPRRLCLSRRRSARRPPSASLSGSAFGMVAVVDTAGTGAPAARARVSRAAAAGIPTLVRPSTAGTDGTFLAGVGSSAVGSFGNSGKSGKSGNSVGA